VSIRVAAGLPHPAFASAVTQPPSFAYNSPFTLKHQVASDTPPSSGHPEAGGSLPFRAHTSLISQQVGGPGKTPGL
jgi:hypothetical protein